MGVVDKGDAMTDNNNNSGQKKAVSWSFFLTQVAREINWPLLASISAHGVFFNAVLPRIGGDVQAQKISATPVIELNPIEQTRLPNLDGMGILPPESQTPGGGENVIPLPPPPWETPPSTPSTPPTVANNIPLPPPPATNYDFPSLPSPPSSSQYDYQSSSPIPSPPPSPPLPPPPPVTDSSLAALPPPPPVGDYSEISPPKTNNSQQEILDEAKRAEIRKQLFANQPIEIAVNPRDVINNRNIKIDLRNQSALDLAKPEAELKSSDTPPPERETVTPTNTNPMTGLEGDNTSDEVARRNYIAWARRVQNIRPKQLEFTGLYPPQACSGRWEGVASYGVVVNPEGRVLEAELLKSSGYPLFNEIALKQINSRQFENDTGNNTSYLVDVKFNYDSTVCAAANTSQVGETKKGETSPEKETEGNPPAAGIIPEERETKNSPSVHRKMDNATPDSATNRLSPDNPSPVKPALKSNPSATQPQQQDNLSPQPTAKPGVAATQPSKDNPPVTEEGESKPEERGNTTTLEKPTPAAENTPASHEKTPSSNNPTETTETEETPPTPTPQTEGSNN